MTISFEAAIAAFSPQLPLTVAYSGGADSSALLLACAHKWPGQINAIHIHHGLQDAADDFEAHCVAICQSIAVPLKVIKVDAKHAPGQSPEAAARDARYGAFSMEKSAVDVIFTAYNAINNIASSHQQFTTIALAQHADDQVETLILALSRGSGLPGMAAMPAQWVRDGIQFHRPLLDVAASDIRRWLATQTQFGVNGAPFVNDPSNANEQYTRNRIRAQLIPVLETVFPQFRDTFTRSSKHAAAAHHLLTQIANDDLIKTGTPPNIKQLQHMNKDRMANLLRHWLKTTHQTTPSTAQLQELMAQIESCTTRGHKIHIKIGNGFVERKAACIDWYNSML